MEAVYGELPYPGQYPFTRGIYESMYRSIETVGAGQLETAISAAADATVVVTAPGLSDAAAARQAAAEIHAAGRSEPAGDYRPTEQGP